MASNRPVRKAIWLPGALLERIRLVRSKMLSRTTVVVRMAFFALRANGVVVAIHTHKKSERFLCAPFHRT